MNIHDQEETCILCRRLAEKDDRYYVRILLLQKIPPYLEHLFDLLPSKLNKFTSFHVSVLLSCTCKRPSEKQQRLAVNIITVEKDLRS